MKHNCHGNKVEQVVGVRDMRNILATEEILLRYPAHIGSVFGLLLQVTVIQNSYLNLIK